MTDLFKKFLKLIFNFNFNFFLKIKHFIEKKSYINKEINNNTVIFFCPNILSKWRVDTLYQKEPETLEWINNFDINKKIIFWDIGANIGLYSIYAAMKFNNINIISFEPSTSNLRILSRNISINSLKNKIKIFQLPLSNLPNHFSTMRESNFIEGGAMNSFGSNLNFEGKDFISNMNYNMFGTSINSLINQEILGLPNYIKIDVDGIEHLIIEGADKYLKDPTISEILVEINENFFDQKNYILNMMKKNNFKLIWKKNNINFIENKKLNNTFNYYFSKNT